MQISFGILGFNFSLEALFQLYDWYFHPHGQIVLVILLPAGDVFYVNWDEVLVGATTVVSTLGGFGSEEQMLRINGEANVVAVNAAKDFGKTCESFCL